MSDHPDSADPKRRGSALRLAGAWMVAGLGIIFILLATGVISLRVTEGYVNIHDGTVVWEVTYLSCITRRSERPYGLLHEILHKTRMVETSGTYFWGGSRTTDGLFGKRFASGESIPSIYMNDAGLLALKDPEYPNIAEDTRQRIVTMRDRLVAENADRLYTPRRDAEGRIVGFVRANKAGP